METVICTPTGWTIKEFEKVIPWEDALEWYKGNMLEYSVTLTSNGTYGIIVDDTGRMVAYIREREID